MHYVVWNAFWDVGCFSWCLFLTLNYQKYTNIYAMKPKLLRSLEDIDRFFYQHSLGHTFRMSAKEEAIDGKLTAPLICFKWRLSQCSNFPKFGVTIEHKKLLEKSIQKFKRKYIATKLLGIEIPILKEICYEIMKNTFSELCWFMLLGDFDFLACFSL